MSLSTHAKQDTNNAPISLSGEKSIAVGTAHNLIIYNDSSKSSPLKRAKSRFQNLADEYSNISKDALTVIMRRYIQQSIKCISSESQSKPKVEKPIFVKYLLKVAKKQSILLIGSAGYGKSTALRWLCLHTRGKTAYVRMCNLNGHTSDIIMTMFKEKLNDNQTVFLDGIDESDVCITNKNFIKTLTDYFLSRNIRFIISARVDHFDGYDSLMNRYFSKKVLTRGHGVSAYEIQGFTLPQFIKAAMMVKQLRKKDPVHFGNKMPVRLVVHNYKRNLSTAFSDNNIFQTPLFSRYAYPLIEAAQKGITHSIAIEKIIKWECHDYISSGNTEEQNTAIDFYTKTILCYLEHIAFAIGSDKELNHTSYLEFRYNLIEKPVDDFLDTETIEDTNLRRECKELIINASLCLLNITRYGKHISFEHDVFKEHFLAKRFANTNLRTDADSRSKFISFSKNKLFIDEYAKQLLANGKIDVLLQHIKPDITRQDPSYYNEYFLHHLYRLLTLTKGITIKPGMRLLPIAELLPNVCVNCNIKDLISPLWSEIYELRQEGIPVIPSSEINNVKGIAISFCRRDSIDTNIDIIESAYKVHLELYEESQEESKVEAIKYLALIYSRMFQKKYPRESTGECYDIMNGIAKFFENRLCESTKYFCYWFSALFQTRGEHKVSISWAKHGLNKTNAVTDASLQTKFYRVILVDLARISPPDWDEFQHYYDEAGKLELGFPFSIQKYQIAHLIIRKRFEEALDIIKKFENDKENSSYFLYLKALCLIHLSECQGVENIFTKLEKLIEEKKDKWDKMNLLLQISDLQMMYWHLKGNKKKLVELARKNIDSYKEFKYNLGINACSYLLNNDDTQKSDYNSLLESIWM